MWFGALQPLNGTLGVQIGQHWFSSASVIAEKHVLKRGKCAELL